MAKKKSTKLTLVAELPTAPPPLKAMTERQVKLEAERAELFTKLQTALQTTDGNVTAAGLTFDPALTRDRTQHLVRRLGLVKYAAELRKQAKGSSMGRPWPKS